MHTPDDFTLPQLVVTLRPTIEPVTLFTPTEGVHEAESFWRWAWEGQAKDDLSRYVEVCERVHYSLLSQCTRHFYGVVDLSQPWQEGWPVHSRGSFGRTYVRSQVGAQSISALLYQVQTALGATRRAMEEHFPERLPEPPAAPAQDRI